MNRQEFIDVLLSRALSAGFADCEAYVSSADSFESMVHEGEIISYEVANSFGLGFRGLIEGKMGYASTQVLDENAIDQLIAGAKANARLIECDDEQFIFAGSDEYQSVSSFNPALEEVRAADKIDMALNLEKRAVSVSPFVKRVSDCGLFTSCGTTQIVNTKGLNISHASNYAGMYLGPVAQDGNNVNSIYKFQLENDFSLLNIEKLARGAALEAEAGLSAAPVASGSYLIALRNDAAADLLKAFSSAFSADAAQKGMSLLNGREGEIIASEAVTLIDDPLLDGAKASSPFDCEGVAAKRKALIDGGRLVTLMHNLKTAKKQGVATTANASRSYNSPIGVSASNLFIAPGKHSAEEIYAMMGDGLLITELQGLHAGANAVTGDFSLAAKGYRIAEGKICDPVNGITVAGNFFDWLMNVRATANDLWFGVPSPFCTGSPTVLAGEMKVAGK